MADVAQVDAVARLDADRQIVQFLDLRRPSCWCRAAPGCRRSRRCPGVTIRLPCLQGLDHVERRQVAGLQLLRVEVDEDGAVLAADHHRGDAAGHAAEHVAHLDAGHVLDVGLVQSLGC